ncbi:M23 family metallopeptidase [Iamia sp.]|uniref:M23 family metallopeptidase n=1 Tax=Iamia sp. TaxID=2722710 RepID=UPI002CEF98A7|nr:M23 family metallopeptidase [Iamia sp.]HXH58556.1 M23 family metallopeptidase [Iamia sp.]
MATNLEPSTGETRRRPWQLPRNTTGRGGRITIDVHQMHRLSRSLTGHLAVLESVRRHGAEVAGALDALVLDDAGDTRRIRAALDTALSDDYGVGRARNLLVRDIGYVVEARERALGADRTDRDERRVIERLIASLTPGTTALATRRKVRRLLRGLYEPASDGSGGSGGSGGSRGGLVKPLATKLTSTSEFRVPDAEGAPDNNGNRYHAGKDWFAPPGTAVRAPIAGKVVEVTPSRGNSGQIFGGVVKVQGANGRVWVFRHVDPTGVKEGQRVDAGDRVAKITNWTGGPDHVHIEHWKTLGGGYNMGNMLDPMVALKRFL